jgi:hypothetical protein
MGGGHFNGKNHGGEHTGDGKKNKCGPYSANGYRSNTQISHLDFIPTEHVYYTGTSKNKSKHYIPNGTEGVILEDDTYNKLQKVPRSVLKVDFGKKGIRYVHKNVLQHVEDYQEYIEELLDTPSMFDGYQADRNEQKKDVKEKLRPERYEQILKNRQKNAEFREWRKDYLRNMETSLYNQLDMIQLAPEYKSKVELRKKLKTEYDELLDKYTDENIVSDFDNQYDGKLYNQQRKKDGARIKSLKDDLYMIQLYFENSSVEIKKINDLLHSGSKQYVRNVNSKQDYNNYLHCIKSASDYDYKDTLLKPSREYKVIESERVAKEPMNLDLLLWGLNPRDVGR